MSTSDLVERQQGVVAPTPNQGMTTMDGMLQAASQRGATIEQMQQLMGMKLEMERQQARRDYNAAFAAFKSEAIKLVRTKKIEDGPLKGKKHADLSVIVESVTPALSRYGLSASWKLSKDDKDWMEVTCTLSHVSGHCESVSMGGAPDTGPGRNAIQARGSAKSYLERYTFTAILGLAAGDADDDGSGGPKVVAAAVEARLSAGRAAAKMGTKAYAEYFKNLSKDERATLRAHTDELKGLAVAADAATTGVAA